MRYYKFCNYYTFEIVEVPSYEQRRQGRRYFYEEWKDFRFVGNDGGYLAKWDRHPVGRHRVNYQRGYKSKKNK